MKSFPKDIPSIVPVAVLALLLTAGCFSRVPNSPANPVSLLCAAPMTPWLRTLLYFDRSNTSDPYNPYSPAEWEKFINEVLVRHLPAGGTLVDNTGWWRRPNGTTFRGIGRTLLVSAPVADSTPHRAGVDSVIAQIKHRYAHHVVFREEERVCTAF